MGGVGGMRGGRRGGGRRGKMNTSNTAVFRLLPFYTFLHPTGTHVLLHICIT